MTPWIHEGRSIEEVPKGAFGFTYIIVINDYVYYGKKGYYSNRTVAKGKKELALQDGRASKKKTVTKPSNWLTYCSSSEEVKKLVIAGHIPKREILDICYSSKELTFRENKLIYKHIEKEHCLNDNCQGKFFKKEILTWNK